MSPPPDPPPFRFCHGDWSSLPAQLLGEKVVLRRLAGGHSLAWRLELGARARVASPGFSCECILGVWDGRVACTLLGNQIDLPSGHFALIPPNLPLTLRAVGQVKAVVVGSLCHSTGESPLFEPL